MCKLQSAKEAMELKSTEEFDVRPEKGLITREQKPDRQTTRRRDDVKSFVADS